MRGDFAGGFQMAFGVGFKPEAGRGQSRVFADAGQHVLQRAPLGRVIEHVAERDQGHVVFVAQLRQAFDVAPIVAAIEHGCAEPETLGGGLAQALQDGADLFEARTRRDQD